jgi:hypothetical protein
MLGMEHTESWFDCSQMRGICFFSLLRAVPGTHSASYSIYTGFKATVDHTSPSGDEVRNKWSYHSTSLMPSEGAQGLYIQVPRRTGQLIVV